MGFVLAGGVGGVHQAITYLLYSEGFISGATDAQDKHSPVGLERRLYSLTFLHIPYKKSSFKKKVSVGALYTNLSLFT